MEIVVNDKPARSFDVQENVLDITRAAVELAWNPKIHLENGLDRLTKSASPDVQAL